MNKLLGRLPLSVAFAIMLVSANGLHAQDRQPAQSKFWTGSENLANYGDLSFEVFSGGRVVMTDTDGVNEGTWQQTGGTVTLRFYNGAVVYTGTLRGSTLSGTARNDRATWDWSVELSDNRELPPLPPAPGQ